MSRILTPRRPVQLMFTATMLAVLAACGGGGGGDSTPTPAAPTWATSGYYSPVLKLQGSTNNSTTATASLSLVHPGSPTTEYVMDATAPSLTADTRLFQGTFDSATQRYNNLVAVSYVDTPNGAVRTTSLAANGLRPAQATAASGTLCANLINANNFASPLSSQLAVKAPGADGVCGTTDDIQSLVTFAANGAPIVTRVTLGNMLGFFRSATTGLPVEWLVAAPNGQLYGQPIGAGSARVIILAPSPALTTAPAYKAMYNLNDLLVYTQNGELRSVGLQGTNTVTSINAPSSQGGPEGWQPAGFDANNVYVYANTSTGLSGAGTWRLLALSRTTKVATTVATGSGSVFAAEAAPTLSLVYATVLNGSTFTTLKVATASGLQTTHVAPSSSVTLVTTSTTGFNGQITATATTPTNYSVAVTAAAGNTLFTAPNSLPLGTDRPFFDVVSGSNPPVSYITLGLSSSVGFAGSAITRFDPVTVSSRSIGVIPNGSELGGLANEPVVVTPISTSTGFGGVAMNRSTNNVYQTSGAAVYTYNTSTANSLTRTTVQVR